MAPCFVIADTTMSSCITTALSPTMPSEDSVAHFGSSVQCPNHAARHATITCLLSRCSRDLSHRSRCRLRRLQILLGFFVAQTLLSVYRGVEPRRSAWYLAGSNLKVHGMNHPPETYFGQHDRPAAARRRDAQTGVSVPRKPCRPEREAKVPWSRRSGSREVFRLW